MEEVAIVGATMVPFGRYPDQEAYQLGARAALDAMRMPASASTISRSCPVAS